MCRIVIQQAAALFNGCIHNINGLPYLELQACITTPVVVAPMQTVVVYIGMYIKPLQQFVQDIPYHVISVAPFIVTVLESSVMLINTSNYVHVIRSSSPLAYLSLSTSEITYDPI